MSDAQSLVVSNEFASVEVRVETRGNGKQALVTDRRSGASRWIDVVALEGLVWAPEWVVAALADPGLADTTEGPQDEGVGPQPRRCSGAPRGTAGRAVGSKTAGAGPSPA